MPRSDPRPCAPSRGHRIRLPLRALAALLCAGMLATPGAWADTVRLGGTGSALGTMKRLAEAYRKTDPTFRLEVVPNLGSSGGLKALARGAVHIAVAGRALKPAEGDEGLTAIEYGRTPFVLATSQRDAPPLTLARIADIYAGRHTVWPDATPIRLVLRPPNDSDTAALAGFSTLIRDALTVAATREGMVVAMTDQEAADEIGRLKGGLGTVTLALLLSEGRDLKPLPIDGVTPSVKTLADGSYPYGKSMHLVTHGPPAGAAAAFIGFIRSPQGRRVLAETGHWVPESDPPGKVAARP